MEEKQGEEKCTSKYERKSVDFVHCSHCYQVLARFPPSFSPYFILCYHLKECYHIVGFCQIMLSSGGCQHVTLPYCVICHAMLSSGDNIYVISWSKCCYVAGFSHFRGSSSGMITVYPTYVIIWRISLFDPIIQIHTYIQILY